MSVVVDAAVVVGAEDGAAHVEDAIVDVVAVAAVDECFVVEKKMTDDGKNVVVVVKAVVLLMNQMIIQLTDQMVISFGKISYYVATVAAADAVEDFFHQN